MTDRDEAKSKRQLARLLRDSAMGLSRLQDRHLFLKDARRLEAEAAALELAGAMKPGLQ
jgi:hypothetical protein